MWIYLKSLWTFNCLSWLCFRFQCQTNYFTFFSLSLWLLIIIYSIHHYMKRSRRTYGNYTRKGYAKKVWKVFKKTERWRLDKLTRAVRGAVGGSIAVVQAGQLGVEGGVTHPLRRVAQILLILSVRAWRLDRDHLHPVTAWLLVSVTRQIYVTKQPTLGIWSVRHRTSAGIFTRQLRHRTAVGICTRQLCHRAAAGDCTRQLRHRTAVSICITWTTSQNRPMTTEIIIVREAIKKNTVIQSFWSTI